MNLFTAIEMVDYNLFLVKVMSLIVSSKNDIELITIYHFKFWGEKNKLWEVAS